MSEYKEQYQDNLIYENGNLLCIKDNDMYRVQIGFNKIVDVCDSLDSAQRLISLLLAGVQIRDANLDNKVIV